MARPRSGRESTPPAPRLKITDPLPPRMAAADALADGLVGVPEACREFGGSDQYLYDAINAGVLPHVAFGRRKLIPRAALRAWLAARYTPAT